MGQGDSHSVDGAAPAPRPVRANERIVALDVLRGFAMFGVLVAYCVWSLGTAPEEAWSPLDQALGAFVGFAVDGKFYTILAFLFGLGFHMQTGRAGDARGQASRLYRRRLLVLAAIGLAHALLLRNGDILLPYAVTGFFLVPFRDSSDRTILAAAVLVLLLPFAAELAWRASGAPMPERPGAVEGGYLAENLAWVRYWYATAILNWPPNLTLFLLGLLAGRHRLVARLSERPRSLWAVLMLGFAAAALLFLLHATLGRGAAPEPPIAARAGLSLLLTFHALALASAYGAALLLLLRVPSGLRALEPLAAIGRLALTNYLMQAALIVPLCLALGLFGRFTPSSSILLAVAVFAAIQLPFSLLWLRRFEFGPAEWLWRLLTYGGEVPIRARQEPRPL